MVIITGPPEAQFKVLILTVFSKLGALELILGAGGRLVQTCVGCLSFKLPCRPEGWGAAFKLALDLIPVDCHLPRDFWEVGGHGRAGSPRLLPSALPQLLRKAFNAQSLVSFVSLL